MLENARFDALHGQLDQQIQGVVANSLSRPEQGI